ncbi:MAG: hypothetical protein H6907_09920 [Hyphomicrobiales bacterium]|nr:hypothetical protein [Hyphomicrobiales bacterium]MCP5372035.1 hypothetical protein [Hyphomicrobiales bacterium]
MSRLIVSSELQRLSLTELWALHAKICDDLIRSPADSAERRNALASLENIRRAINTSKPMPRLRGP